MPGFNSQKLFDRMKGVAIFDANTFAEVETDRDAIIEALIVVALAAIAAGIGTLASDGITGLVAGVIGGVLGWVVYSISAYIVADRVFPVPSGQTNPWRLLRTLGYANTPRLLFFFGFFPFFGGMVTLVAFFWWILTSILALKESLDSDWTRAVTVGLIALIPFAIVMLLFYWIFGISPPGRG